MASSTVSAQQRAPAYATATAGYDREQGFGRRGESTAFARGVSAGNATASATGYGGRTNVRAEAIGGTGGARAVAYGFGNDIGVAAGAYSSAVGASENTASASAQGSSGSARAESVSVGANGTTVRTTAVGSAGRSQERYAQTSANVGGQFQRLTYLVDHSTLAYATAAPDSAAVTAALERAPRAAAALAGQEVIGIGVMQGSFEDEGVAQQVPAMTATNFQFVTSGERYLTLGLLGGRSYWGGETGTLELTISNHGTELFTQTFDDLAQAQLFFNDHTVGLGLLMAGAQDILVSAEYSVSTNDFARYGFQYALALAPVPEPQTWIVMLLGLTVIGTRYGRRKT